MFRKPGDVAERNKSLMRKKEVNKLKGDAVAKFAGLDEAQSSMRTRLITLTSVGAAVYLGYYIFPLVGASHGAT